MATANDDEILEGFLCPICKADLKSATQLTNHFETQHAEEQDLLRSLKDIFGKAKKIILNVDENDLKDTFDRALKINTQDNNSWYTEETQTVVPWLDGSSVKLCPNCAKSFSLTRRKHHCRLCGSILCHDCSLFLDFNVAKGIVDPSAPQTSTPDHEVTEKNGLRLCEHCYMLIDLRKQVQDSRNAKTALMTAYEQMRSLMEQASPAVAMYEKMCQSLFDGESTYNLQDVNAMRGKIGKLAEGIDLLSKQVSLFPANPGTRQARLQNSIRQAAANFIKGDLLSLRKLPTEAQIDEVRRQRYERAQKKVEMERQAAEKEKEWKEREGSSRDNSVQHDDELNPLLEQMNIIRGYIKEARKELRFEEVAILEENLKELKKEYHFQMLSNKS
ncbi:rabenosyn-5 isoform X2 [Leptidea sinapis]|uniref:rabenosyn-5 isoform X2 n=1 Tax=Leptidea sinapis TaxID=189913 RepID=UPI0021C2F9FD|nr:rabenosyn-5 isoform X2 [Leptidea sinapis]